MGLFPWNSGNSPPRRRGAAAGWLISLEISGNVECPNTGLFPKEFPEICVKPNALTSVSATLRRDARGAKGRVKEWNEGLDSGIMARRMESHAVRAPDEVPVARASKGVAQGLGDGGAGGAAGDVALPLRGRSEEEIKGEGNWEVTGVLEGEEGCVAGVAGGDGESPEPREGTLGGAAVKKAGSARGRSGRIIQKGEEGA